MSSILDLAIERGLVPKKTSSTDGGEYHSGCPRCGGENRFALWPAKGRYWCRRCDAKGDEIQFCRDFFGLSFPAACARLGRDPNLKNGFPGYISQEPRLARQPTNTWREKGEAFVNYCVSQSTMLKIEDLFTSRGISIHTARTFNLGYNPRFWRRKGSAWGLEGIQHISLPAGLVIPSYEPETNSLQSIKIRRFDPKRPKYHQVVGSSDALSIFGYRQNTPVVVLESELDAMLLMQEARDRVWVVATGGSSKKPDLYLDGLIRSSPLIIHVPDYDDAGAASISFWRGYSNYKLYCTPKEKSVGDAYQAGVDLHHWITQAIRSGNYG